jgi:small subunit ribosomal protein S16
MVVIRLARGGTVKRPFSHLVVADRRRARGGKYIERIGFFNPIAKGGEERLRVDLGRVDHWTARGAQPSERVTGLLKQYRATAKAA